MAIELDGSVKWLKSAYRTTAEFFGVGCAEHEDEAYLIILNLNAGTKSETWIHAYTISTGDHIVYHGHALTPEITQVLPGSTVRSSTHIYEFFTSQDTVPNRYLGFSYWRYPSIYKQAEFFDLEGLDV